MIKKEDFNRYFFNNLYDDSLIQEKQTDFQNRLYHNILKGKEWIQNSRIINGRIEYLEINPSLNEEFNLPPNTYSLQLNENLIPFYSEKAYFEKYGYGSVISSLDILRDTRIFSKTFYFFVNNYLIFDTKLILWRDKCIVLIIPTSDDRRSWLSGKDFEELLLEEEEDSWTIMLGTKADYYISPLMERTRLFKTNKLYLNKCVEYKNYEKPVTNNYWTMYVTGRYNSYNAMIAVNVTLEEDSDGQYFLIPEEFKNYISKKGSNFKCFVVNEPECGGTGIYVDTEGIDPIFQIPFKKNPIPKGNLLVWAYDGKNKRKLHPLEVHVDLYYPNIYDFREMMLEAYYVSLYTKSKELVKDSDKRRIIFGRFTQERKRFDLYIEWIEPMGDVSAYDSYLQDYMEDHKLEWASMIFNNDLPEFIRDYHPLSKSKVGALDYFNSNFYGDYRAWKLENIVRLMNDNPKRYDEFYHMAYYRAKMYITRTYNYETEPHIYEKRSLLDNKSQCDNFEEVLMLFKTPQTFLAIYDYHDEAKPVTLFINGLFVRRTYDMKYGSTFYVYFDKSLVDNRETIQIDIELVNEKIEKKKFTFESVKSKLDMESLEFERKVSLNNIIFIDQNDNYISKDNFDFKGKIDIDEIEYVGGGYDSDFLSHLSSETILHDNQEDMYVPTSHDYVVLKSETKKVEIENKESMKNIDTSNIIISPSEGKGFSYLHNPIQIATTDFYEISHIDFSPEYIRENGYTYTYHNFKGKPSIERFRIYSNGLRLHPSDFKIEFSKYNGDALFIFNPDFVSPGKIVIQYCGYDEIIIFDGLIRSLKDTVDEILYIGEYIDTPFDNIAFKIFIDGRRISDDQIKTVGQGNMLIINPTYYDFTNESRIVIYQQKNDPDPYEYTKDTQFLDKVAINEDRFRNYLIEKYK